ncbi:hypothetical protein ACLB2K_072113 [Fragaria x ananassa]
MAAAGFWFHLFWFERRSLLVARLRWWLGVVAWLDLFSSSCRSTRMWCRFRREDDDHIWRMVVRCIRRDGEGKTWSTTVVVSILWIRVSDLK